MIRPVLPVHLQECLEAAADGLDMVSEMERSRVSRNTVKSRRKQLCEVLGSRDRTQAVAVAFRLGLLDVKPAEMPDEVLVEAAPLDLLIRARQLRGWSLAYAAGRMGRTHPWLLRRESGVCLFGWNELAEYAGLLGLDLGGRR